MVMIKTIMMMTTMEVRTTMAMMRRLKAASSVVLAGAPAAHVAGEHYHCGNRSKNDNDDCNEENDENGDDDGDNEGDMGEHLRSTLPASM